ncbi:MAG: hypothetical protein A2070_03625 [Bdellovibrionales bacterium GWC1_52_8]|nr:MAG: hypothetical protein A2Z97_02795 [Bdellovibrionales bacterium GWB1_52_6]OFZ05824.1 MAG: hypothetical protein A2X97_03945 [Bdellovibrionales bacterium GWA1_52_35]OFZ39333.1 MAG: hypothetical protein A2070_03625 [Bdellovibrionales bacterium GWC1_52_8]
MAHPFKAQLKAQRLGILGSGQLARMLVQAAQKMGISPTILADHPDSPAAQVCPSVVIGSIRDAKTLRGFLSGLDQVIFENEFIPCDVIQHAAEGLPVVFSPTIEAMRFLQDKLNQKQILQKLRIPCTRYIAAPFPLEDPAAWLLSTQQNLGDRFVIKWAQLGYDGKGTFTFANAGDLSRAVLFCNEANLKKVQVYAEEFIPFRRELAIIGCHSRSGEYTNYPPVISEQENHVCLWTKGPASALSVKAPVIRAAEKAAETLARAIPLHGVFAIEFFETKKGKLLVNEIAPRVHNTGHFTLNASDTDQFENHIRAISGMPLGSPRSRPAFAMINLIGPPELRKKVQAPALPSLVAGLHLHWYGKQELHPGRKMGHLNGSTEQPKKFKTLVAELEACKNCWLEQVRRKS